MSVMKKLLCICLMALMIFNMSAQSVQASNSEKKEETVSYTEDEKKQKLVEIENWLIGDIWNRGYCDLGWYAHNKTNSTGGKMDVNYSIKKFKKAYKKLNEYDKFINSLSGKKYKSLKNAWKHFKKESKSLNKEMKTIKWKKAPFDEDVFNTDLINTYIMDIYDEIYKLAY